MIMKTINDIDRFYDLLYSIGMQGPIDLNIFNIWNNFYSSEVGVYYVVKKKYIIFYYEDGRPGKDGMIQKAKSYVVVRVVCRSGKWKLIGEYIPNPALLVFLMLIYIPFPIGILLGILLLYILSYDGFKKIESFLDKICK